MSLVTLEIRRGGDTWTLTDETNYALIAYDGFGMAPVARMSEKGPQQHGVTDGGFRLEPRIISLVIDALATDLASLYVRQRDLLNALKPDVNPVLLRYTYPTAIVREIQCHYAGGVELGTGSRQGYSARVGVQLLCPDPIWYDPVTQSESFGIAAGGSGFVVPMVVPVKIGAATISTSKAVNYLGDWISYPTVRIVGPIQNAVVTNTTTDEKLDFTGLTIAAGDHYDINCAYGVKTVTDGNAANQIDHLTDDSDLATFHLAADPEAVDGINVFSVTGIGCTGATQVYLSYYLRYTGV